MLRKVFILLPVLLITMLPELSAKPFPAPEKLEYDLTWGGLKAGTSSLQLKAGRHTWEIISKAHSADWVSVFYKVEDRIESTLLPGLSSPLGIPENYRIKLREGRHRRDKEVIFHQQEKRAVFIDHLKKEKKEFKVPYGVFDPLSAFYDIRSRELRVGESQWVHIFDSKKLWHVEVQVLRKERIKLPVGTFSTIVIKPLMQSEGIFQKKGDVTIWLTDDARRIPVRLQTKVPVGHITATLVRGI
jgi:hypothetical protein